MQWKNPVEEFLKIFERSSNIFRKYESQTQVQSKDTMGVVVSPHIIKEYLGSVYDYITGKGALRTGTITEEQKIKMVLILENQLLIEARIERRRSKRKGYQLNLREEQGGLLEIQKISREILLKTFLHFLRKFRITYDIILQNRLERRIMKSLCEISHLILSPKAIKESTHNGELQHYRGGQDRLVPAPETAEEKKKKKKKKKKRKKKEEEETEGEEEEEEESNLVEFDYEYIWKQETLCFECIYLILKHHRKVKKGYPVVRLFDFAKLKLDPNDNYCTFREPVQTLCKNLEVVNEKIKGIVERHLYSCIRIINILTDQCENGTDVVFYCREGDNPIEKWKSSLGNILKQFYECCNERNNELKLKSNKIREIIYLILNILSNFTIYLNKNEIIPIFEKSKVESQNQITVMIRELINSELFFYLNKNKKKIKKMIFRKAMKLFFIIFQQQKYSRELITELFPRIVVRRKDEVTKEVISRTHYELLDLLCQRIVQLINSTKNEESEIEKMKHTFVRPMMFTLTIIVGEDLEIRSVLKEKLDKDEVKGSIKTVTDRIIGPRYIALREKLSEYIPEEFEQLYAACTKTGIASQKKEEVECKLQ